MPGDNTNNYDGRTSGGTYLMSMLSQALGPSTLLFVAHQALSNGAMGRTLVYMIVYVVVGLPLTYIEYVVGQFTGRDCIEVWRARDCLSHFGYAYVVWQIWFLMYCQTMSSFVLHYFLITFETPIPYHSCGSWSTPDCNILNRNYSIYQECFRAKDARSYCKDIIDTYPEYQYWRFFILGLDKNHFHFAWRVSLASTLLCAIVFLTCFRRLRSWKWVLGIVVIYPTCARFLFFIGSMLQKGIAAKFEKAMDTDFSIFVENFDFANCVTEILYNLNLGTGIGFNLSSRAPFRSPCYANSVIVIFTSCIVTILGICSTAMMACPYTYTYNIDPCAFMMYPIANIFEKLPKLLSEYSKKWFWLLISFSYITVSSLSLITLLSICLIEMMAKRDMRVANHPGLVAFLFSVILLLTTAPFLGNKMFYIMVDIKYTMHTIVIFLIAMQSVVFVMWYGMEKFTEDIHFMQGIQPKLYFKLNIILATITVTYVFVVRLYENYLIRDVNLNSLVGFWLTVTSLILLILTTVIKLLIAVHKKSFHLAVRLDPTWGPRSDILKRSRTLFSAQAMTKEYIYRQYHLQAGIIERQKTSNIRAHVEVPF